MATSDKLPELIQYWKDSDQFIQNVNYWGESPGKEPQIIDFPSTLNPSIRSAIENSGISKLYRHQRLAWDSYQQGFNLCIATGTSSGKSLVYNLAVFNELKANNKSTALYIFPTKALSQDQKVNIDSFNIQELKVGLYDGDTKGDKRVAIRKSSNIILTNPDMLNVGILPRHNNWKEFIENLRVVVIDEIHTYRGVFGSHVANVISRLSRIAKYYGSNPCYILTSATINNPKQHAENLISGEVRLIVDNSAGSGKKHFLIYNPPILNRDLGIRESVFDSTLKITKDLSDFNIQSIVFGKSRKIVENLNIAFKRLIQDEDNHSIRAYRSGYLPESRREIENDIREGTAQIVFATNALELGIDYGGIDAIVMSGYPGSIASTLQQSGRAGRKSNESLSIFIASPNPIDQFIVNNPQYLVSGSPESALINPRHLSIAFQHFKASIFELPLTEDLPFNHLSDENADELLKLLSTNKIISTKKKSYYWIGAKYPSSEISLRTTTNNTFQIILASQVGNTPNLGTIDFNSVDFLVHPGAVYLHDGKTFKVVDLDFDTSTVKVEKFEGQYITQSSMDSIASILEKLSIIESNQLETGLGELLVTRQVTSYKRIDSISGRVLERIPLSLPKRDLFTHGLWFSLKAPLIANLESRDLWRNDRLNYGPSWKSLRAFILARDKHICQNCFDPDRSTLLHVHHRIPFRSFANPADANHPANLISLCPACHQLAENHLLLRSGLAGISYLLRHVASIFLMCDLNDLSVFYEPNFKEIDGNPTIVLYENIPGGLGFCEELYHHRNTIIDKSISIIENCPCNTGCPSCVGPGGSEGSGGKKEALAIFVAIQDNLHSTHH